MSSLTEDFLNAVRQTTEKRCEVLPQGKPLWRAQLGCEYDRRYDSGNLVSGVPRPHDRRPLLGFHRMAQGPLEYVVMALSIVGTGISGVIPPGT